LKGNDATAGHLKDLARRGLKIGADLKIQPKTLKITFEAPARINRGTLEVFRSLRIGAFSYLRSGILRNLSNIGRYCSIGPNVIIGEAEHPTTWLSTSPAQYSLEQFAFFEDRDAVSKRLVKRHDNAKASPCQIGNDVWIGANVIIRNGVKIGDGAIVGANSLVLRDVPPYSVVAGSPAKLFRKRFSDEVIDNLLKLRWWEFHINSLAGIDFSDIGAATAAIESKEAGGLIARGSFEELTVIFTRNLVWTIESNDGTAPREETETRS
jgi:acetyltransferase-like isoleucine patch superfamily enzyme